MYLAHQVEPGDVIIACPKDQDAIMGKVQLICEIPELKKNQIFVGVDFVSL